MKNDFRQRYGPWALVTGASSGIGREFARQIAAQGLNVVLVARRVDRLEELAADLIAQHGIEARVVAVDLSGDDILTPIRAATAGLAIGLLVNAAGFSLTGPYMAMEPAEMNQMVNLNGRAPAELVREFGPAMQTRQRGGIIFLSSVTGFVGTPQFSLYAATKAFNLLLGEGLAAELRGDGVDVVSLAPGTTRTEFLEKAGLSDFMSLDPAGVAQHGLAQLGRADVVVVGWFYRLGIFTTRLLPRAVNRSIFGHILNGMRKQP